MKDILQTLVAFPTVTGNEHVSLQALDYVSRYLKARGMYVKHFNWDAHPSIVATTIRDENKPRVLLSAHIDVMPAPTTMFNMRRDDDNFYGRGVWDMKCAIATYMQLVDDIKDHIHNYNFGIMITSDEELGGKDGVNSVKKLIDAGYTPEVVVMPDGGENWQMETFAKGFLHMTLKAYGKAAHGSRPWEGDNAIIKLIDALSGIKGGFTTKSKSTETINIGIINGGDIVNKIPDYAQAEIEMRLMTPEAGIKLMRMVEEICIKYDVTAVTRAFFEPTVNKLSDPHLTYFANCIQQITGIVNQGMMSYGGTDARFFTPAGIPVALVRSPGGGFHGDGEWVEQKGLYQLRDIVRLFVEEKALKI